MFAHTEGGRGRGALHPSDAAQDRAAVQAGGKGRSECVSVPEEILPSRARVSMLSLPFCARFLKSSATFLKITNFVLMIL